MIVNECEEERTAGNRASVSAGYASSQRADVGLLGKRTSIILKRRHKMRGIPVIKTEMGRKKKSLFGGFGMLRKELSKGRSVLHNPQ